MAPIDDIGQNRVDPCMNLCCRRPFAAHRIVQVVSPRGEFINEHIGNEIRSTSVILVNSGPTQANMLCNGSHTDAAALSHHGCGCLDECVAAQSTVFSQCRSVDGGHVLILPLLHASCAAWFPGTSRRHRGRGVLR